MTAKLSFLEAQIACGYMPTQTMQPDDYRHEPDFEPSPAQLFPSTDTQSCDGQGGRAVLSDESAQLPHVHSSTFFQFIS